MINIKPIIVSALKADGELRRLLNGPNVHRQYPADKIDLTKMSLLVYSETSNKTMEEGDGIELVAKILLQIDVWSVASTSEIALAVDRIMVGIGGVRHEAADDDEAAPLQCKAMAYEFIVDNELNFF